MGAGRREELKTDRNMNWVWLAGNQMADIIYDDEAYLGTVCDVFIINMDRAPPLQSQAHTNIGVSRSAWYLRCFILHGLLEIKS